MTRTEPVQPPKPGLLSGSIRRRFDGTVFRLGLKLLVFGMVCAFLWSSMDVAVIGRLLAAASPGWLLLALGVVQLQIVLSALRWRFTAARLGRSLGRQRVIAEYYLATLLNQTLPGGVTGDAARILRNRDAGGSAVVIERLAGQLVFLLVTLIGLVFWQPLVGSRLPHDGLVTVALVVGMLLLGIVLAGVACRIGPPAWRNRLGDFGRSVYRSWVAEGSWQVQAGLSLCIVLTYLGVFGLCSLAIGQPLPWAGLVTVVPLVLLTMLVPLSVGGWGVREAAAALLWPLLGASAEAGVASSVLYGLVSLAGSLPGLVVLWLPNRRS